MQNILVIILFTCNITAYVKNYKSGLTFYIMGCFIFPCLNLGGKLSYEILMFPFMFFFFLCYKWKTPFKIGRNDILRLVFCILLLCATFSGMLKYKSGINVTGIFGSVRRMFILLAGREIFIDKRRRELLFTVLLYVNILVTFLEAISARMLRLFQNFYSKNENDVLANTSAQRIRCTGTFFTPILLGVFSLFAFTYLLYKLLFEGERNKRRIVQLLLTILMGILASSKISIFGFLVIGFLESLLWLKKFSKRFKRYWLIEIVVFSGAMILFFTTVDVISAAQDYGIPLNYYLNYFKNPMKIFATRYGGLKVKFLEQTVAIIKDNLLWGIGYADVEQTFFGDSSIYSLLLTTGISGFGIWAVIYGNNFYKAAKKKNYLSTFILIGALCSSLGINVETTVIGILIFGFAEGVNESENGKASAIGVIN